VKSSQPIDYGCRIVAYLDILGFRNLVLSGAEAAEETIATLDGSLNHTLQCIKETEGADPDWCSVKLFSDCICISCEDTINNLHLMLSEVSFLQWFLAGDAIFLAGGLAVGHHFESPRIIFSEGLVRAYDLQAHDPFPRVLVDVTVQERIRSESLGKAGGELLSYVMCGQDGVVFLDYLQYAAEMASYTGNLDDLLSSHKEGILRQVKDKSLPPRVLAKYRWLSDYHNFKFAELYNQEDWVDGYFEEFRERLTIPSTVFRSFKRPETKA